MVAEGVRVSCEIALSCAVIRVEVLRSDNLDAEDFYGVDQQITSRTCMALIRRGSSSCFSSISTNTAEKLEQTYSNFKANHLAYNAHNMP